MPKPTKGSSDGRRKKSEAAKAADEIREAGETLSQVASVLGQSLSEYVSASTEASIAKSLRAAARSLETVSTKLSSGQKAARTRETLLDAAVVVVAGNGYEGASLADIATEAGFTKGAIYSQFDSKEDLVLAVIERHFGQGSRWQGVGDDRPLADVLTEHLADTFEEVRGEDLAFTAEAVLFGIRHPDHQDVLNRGLERIVGDLARAIARDRLRREAVSDDPATVPGALDYVTPNEDDRRRAIGIVGIIYATSAMAQLGLPGTGADDVAELVRSILAE